MSQPSFVLADPARLPQQVTALAQHRPEATALVWMGARTAYGEFDQRCNRLASLLVDSRCPPGTRVALLVPKGDLAIVAMLGALKAGAICVPIDCSESARRIARVLRAADCRWILGGGQAAVLIEDALAVAQLENEPLLGWLDAEPSRNPRTIFELADLDAFPATPPLVSRPPRVAQLLFNCGAIGTPKGRPASFDELLRFVQWGRDRCAIGPDSVLCQYAPLHLDAAGFEVFSALATGAALHIAPPELNLWPDRLARFIRESQLTHWLSTAPALNLLARADVVRDRDFPAMRHVIVAGEELPVDTLAHLAQRLPQVHFHSADHRDSDGLHGAPPGRCQPQRAQALDLDMSLVPPPLRAAIRGAPVVAG